MHPLNHTITYSNKKASANLMSYGFQIDILYCLHIRQYKKLNINIQLFLHLCRISKCHLLFQNSFLTFFSAKHRNVKDYPAPFHVLINIDLAMLCELSQRYVKAASTSILLYRSHLSSVYCAHKPTFYHQQLL